MIIVVEWAPARKVMPAQIAEAPKNSSSSFVAFWPLPKIIIAGKPLAEARRQKPANYEIRIVAAKVAHLDCVYRLEWVACPCRPADIDRALGHAPALGA